MAATPLVYNFGSVASGLKFKIEVVYADGKTTFKGEPPPAQPGKRYGPHTTCVNRFNCK